MEIERETMVPANWKAAESAIALLNLATCFPSKIGLFILRQNVQMSRFRNSYHLIINIGCIHVGVSHISDINDISDISRHDSCIVDIFIRRFAVANKAMQLSGTLTEIKFTEVKARRLWLVLRWVLTMEYRML